MHPVRVMRPRIANRLHARGMRAIAAGLASALLACLLAAPAVQAQSSREAQRKLDKVKRELRNVADERRKVESQRGDATRQLRQVDEQVGATTRSLKDTEARLQRGQAELTALQAKRDALQLTLASQRKELAGLLRAAYTVGDDAALKVMLAQDKVADANRMLTYHGYLQRARAQRIAALRAELAGLEQVERQIAQARKDLADARARQQAQVAQLERDRKARASTVAELDARYKDKRAREQALGRDAKGLEKVLAQLRAAARRAAAERKAAEAAARRAAASTKGTGGSGKRGGSTRPKPPVIANATPIQVGGLGWPVSGTLITPYGGTLPDGRRSAGILIAAATGTTVRAVANGKVVFAEWMSGYGLICIVDHGNGYMSLYANNDGLLRDAGADVKRGDPVASVGNSGGQGRAALYFELRKGGSPVNPRTWLQQR